MTETCRRILEEYQVRKSAKQKLRFIEFLQSRYPELRVEEGGWPRCRNLILGDPDSAQVILTAHYDTCARLPFPNFITPKNLLITLAYSLVITLPFFVIPFFLEFLAVRYLPEDLWWSPLVALALGLFLVYYVFIGGPANPHTVNDNTSGVLTLCLLLDTLSPEQRAKAAFVFFDHEESGLFGSSRFARLHAKGLKNKLIVNFDCVSDGDHLFLVQSRRARKHWGERLAAAYQPREGKEIRLERSAFCFYPSDQMNFPCAVGVAALRKAPVIGYYMGRIHTARDTVMDERNLEILAEGTARLLETVQAK